MEVGRAVRSPHVLTRGVMRANFLAKITAVKAFRFFDNFGEFWWNFFLIFNRKIRNAKASVDDSRSDDRAGGAGAHAFVTIATNIERFLGRVRPAGEREMRLADGRGGE